MFSRASREFAPYFLAYKAAIVYAQTIGGANLKEMNELLEKFIAAKILKKNIRAASLDTVADVVGALKSVTSLAALGFNTRVFTQTMLSSIYQAATRTGTGLIPGQEGHVTEGELWKALQIVSGQVAPSLSTCNLLAHINRHYAMAGYSINEMAETNKVKRHGLQQISESDAYLGSKLPDDYFRNAVVIARMLHDGCFDAYVETGDGIEYDIRKDKRFNVLFDENGIIAIEDASNVAEWRKQNDLYCQYINN